MHAFNNPALVDAFLNDPHIRTIFNFYPLFIMTYLFYCFLGDVELSFDYKIGTGGVIFGLNLSKKNGNTVICGGKNAACTEFY